MVVWRSVIVRTAFIQASRMKHCDSFEGVEIAQWAQ